MYVIVQIFMYRIKIPVEEFWKETCRSDHIEIVVTFYLFLVLW